MAADSSWALQQAVHDALSGDATLMGMVGGVYDHVPQGGGFPYVTVGDGLARAWGAVDVAGVEATLVLHVWSRERGRREVKQIMAEIRRVLDDAALSLSGHALISLRFEQSRTLLEPDGLTYHGITRFRAVTHEA